MWRILNPRAKLPCGPTVKKDIITAFHAVKERVKAHLQRLTCKMAFTTDIWTTKKRKHSFMAVTVHWVEETVRGEWLMRRCLVDFIPFDEAHTAAKIAAKLDDTIWVEWGLGKRIAGITLDNAASNIAAMDILVRRRGLDPEVVFRCVAHVMNLAVQTILEREEVKCVADKLRQLNKHLNDSSKRIQEFQDECARDGMQVEGLCGDMEVRWGSTKAMVERALYVQKAVKCWLASRPSNDACPVTLDNTDWETMEQLLDLLKPFDEVTKEMEAAAYPTLSLAVPAYNEILAHLDAEVANADSKFKAAARAAKAKVQMYYNITSEELTVSTVMDPGLNLKFFQPDNGTQQQVGEIHPDTVKQLVNTKWEPYAPPAPAAGSTSGSGSSGIGSSNGVGEEEQPCEAAIVSATTSGSKRAADRTPKEVVSWCRSRAQQKKDSQQPSASELSEIERYMQEPMARAEDWTAMQWWSSNKHRFPYVAAMARDYLCIPGTSAESERVFSQARWVVSERYSLDEETIQVSMCLVSWFRCGFNQW
jgi:hypothetical protein